MLARAQAIIWVRRQRDQLFGESLFGEAAWDILLDLFVAELSGTHVAVSSACLAAAVPPTTALRWLTLLTNQGLIVRTPDKRDGRRVYVALAPDSFDKLKTLLSRTPPFASRGSPSASSSIASP